MDKVIPVVGNEDDLHSRLAECPRCRYDYILVDSGDFQETKFCGGCGAELDWTDYIEQMRRERAAERAEQDLANLAQKREIESILGKGVIK